MTRTLQRRAERLMSVDTAVTIGSNFMLIASGATLTIATTPRIKTGRNTVYSSGGVVVSISPLAVSAGIGEFSAGGNAFDAAVAVAAVESVTVPPSCGLGGEPFVIMYDAKSGLVHGANGSGKAPLAASRSFFVDRGHRFMPLEGPLAAAIPGEVLAWEQIAERFGTRPLSKLLEPAIEYAENGFAISEELARGFEILSPKLARFPESKEIFTHDGRPLLPGETLVQKDLARTLKQIASGGAEAFYKGDIGREMARAIQAAGGLYTAQEIAEHENEWYQPPISTTYHGHTLYETAPPSQGLTLLEMLNILEGYDLAEMGFYTAESVHTMVEAKKLAFADRNKYAGDMDFVKVPVSELISKRFAARRRETITETAGRGEALEPTVSAPGDGNTSYFCVVDAEGNAVSFIHSLSMGFGSGFVAGETGVLLNNRVGRGFSLVEGHPNVIEGGKRTMHTLNAYMVMRDDRPYVIGGTPGGDNQIGWNAQVITNVLDHSMTAQEAVEAPRWTSTPGTDPHSVDDPFVLELEGGMSAADIESLKANGHDVLVHPGRVFGGSAKLIVIDPATGVRMAGSDPRSDGQAGAV